MSYDKRVKKYAVRISTKKLGYYDDEIEAAKLYDIYAFLTYGKNAKTNGLIEYEKVKNLEINEKIERILPRNISMRDDGKYYAKIIYKGVTYRSLYFNDINQAIDFLNEFKEIIQNIKNSEKALKNQETIIRNTDNLAIIRVHNQNRNTYDDIIVDDDKWHDLSTYKWNVNNYGYARAIINSKEHLMHAYLMNFDECDILIDHINHNKLDNRINNLRKTDARVNNHNRTKIKNTTSIYKGVSLCKNKKWHAKIGYNNKSISIGRFDNEKYAAIAYNKEAKKLYGDDASLNDNIDIKEYEEYDRLYTDKSLRKIQSSKYRGVVKLKKSGS